jgi:ribosomal protein L11 methyltransferase
MAVAVHAAVHDAELVADQLFALGATAVSEQPLGEGVVQLVCDLDQPGIAALATLGEPHQVLEPETAWTEGWREHAHVRRCGERIVIRPAWVESVGLGACDVELVVEPGAAFGTGSHATTRLCLVEAERLVSGGERVLDVGCGTGVLGVAAALLGAASVDAVDIDPHAVEVTRGVAQANGVAAVVTASTTPLGELDGHYDLVLANLLIPIVERLAEDLTARLAPGGTLVVSGILEGQVDRVATALPALEVDATTSEEGWAAIVLRERRRASLGRG